MGFRFRRELIADERFETAAVFDINGDGHPDIYSGEWWYEGPDFRRRHRVGAVRPAGEYFDDFSAIPVDVNGDGRADIVTGGWFGKTLQWRENPGDPEAEWPLHDIAEIGNIETARAWDIDGDGHPEIVPNTPNDPLRVFRLERDEEGRGAGRFTGRMIFDGPQKHGLGCGDIAGAGRKDLVLAHGWLEAPADPWTGEWTFHDEFNLGRASVPILVADVNEDGLNDLIVGQGHGYGLSWWEQRRDGDQREWVEHPIDPWTSQYHELLWVDMDGDGAPELVAGKRYRAHCGKDPGAGDDVGVYVFKWTGEAFVKQIVCHGPTREGTGLGLHAAVSDLNGDGRPDIVAPGKDGLYVFWNECD